MATRHRLSAQARPLALRFFTTVTLFPFAFMLPETVSNAIDGTID